jgi:hypothetical protein
VLHQRELVSKDLYLGSGWVANVGCLGGFSSFSWLWAALLASAVARPPETKRAWDLLGLGLSRQARAVGENSMNTTAELRLRERGRGWADDGGGFSAGQRVLR